MNGCHYSSFLCWKITKIIVWKIEAENRWGWYCSGLFCVKGVTHSHPTHNALRYLRQIGSHHNRTSLTVNCSEPQVFLQQKTKKLANACRHKNPGENQSLLLLKKYPDGFQVKLSKAASSSVSSCQPPVTPLCRQHEIKGHCARLDWSEIAYNGSFPPVFMWSHLTDIQNQFVVLLRIRYCPVFKVFPWLQLEIFFIVIIVLYHQMAAQRNNHKWFLLISL